MSRSDEQSEYRRRELARCRFKWDRHGTETVWCDASHDSDLGVAGTAVVLGRTGELLNEGSAYALSATDGEKEAIADAHAIAKVLDCERFVVLSDSRDAVAHAKAVGLENVDFKDRRYNLAHRHALRALRALRNPGTIEGAG